MIISFVLPIETEYAAALATGAAVEWRPGDQPLRLLPSGPESQLIEINTLGERVYSALEHTLWPSRDRDTPMMPRSPELMRNAQND